MAGSVGVELLVSGHVRAGTGLVTQPLRAADPMALAVKLHLDGAVDVAVDV